MGKVRVTVQPLYEIGIAAQPQQTVVISAVQFAPVYAESAALTIPALNQDTVTLSAGMVVCRHPSGAGVYRATALGNARHGIGLMLLAASPGFVGRVQLAGTFELEDWTAITGAAALQALGVYYLSETPGQLTTTPPAVSGTVQQQIGRALSTTVMQIDVAYAILN